MVIVKNECPKLSPEERLARKRAAARLRQQRCRARKRQAMLEKKRGEVGVDIRQRCVKIPTHDPTRAHANAVIHVPHSSPHHCSQSTRFPPSYNHHSMTASEPVGAESWVGGFQQSQKLSSEQRSIYNCVSFDSQKSFEDARSKRQQQPPPSSPPRSFSSVSEQANSSIQLVTPSRTPPPTGNQEQQTTTISTVLSDEKQEEPLVSEEEAAVVAMLSLKSALKLDSKDLTATKCDDDVADECNDTTTTTTTTDSEQTKSSLPNKVTVSQHESSSSNNYPSSDISGVLHSKQQLRQSQYHHEEHLRHEQHIMQLQSQQRQHKNNPHGLYETAYLTHNNYGPPPSLQQISPTRRTTQPIPGGYYRMHSRPPTHHLHPHHNHYSRGTGVGGYYPPPSRYAHGI